ncbi:hypothetical protein [Mesorhizobium sp. CO1-1-9]|uniref:hypothetical protein n=1 Tax=Mesorhizobium sp. CO1-1-9 TaxID=2876630 RepID=UPI001CC8F795|nr:hypothetical protein [Mesorhizobium sp. CO1-1-9]MBZ9693929.1 hypothetical protein [Mesorhizobium sp. CO1-1-9]
MFDGQFYPYQPLQFMDGLLSPIMGVGSPMTVSFLASAVVTTTTVTIPATAAAGDIAFLIDAIIDGTITSVRPSGWTNIDEVAVTGQGSNSIRMICSYKILGSGDPGSSVTGMASANPARKTMLVFRGSRAITSCVPATPVSSQTNNVAGNPSALTIAASAGNAPSVSIASWRSSSTITGRVFSPASDAEVANGTTMYTAYKSYDSSPLDTALTMTAGTGTKIQEGFYAVLS